MQIKIFQFLHVVMNVIFGDPHLRKLAFTAVGLGGACVLFIDYMYLSTSC